MPKTKTIKKKITSKGNKLEKCPTGIKGFDEIIDFVMPFDSRQNFE